jgi:hypothetical protein
MAADWTVDVFNLHVPRFRSQLRRKAYTLSVSKRQLMRRPFLVSLFSWSNDKAEPLIM